MVNLASSLRVCGAGRAAVVPGRLRPSPLSGPVIVGQDHVETFCQDLGHDHVHKCRDWSMIRRLFEIMLKHLRKVKIDTRSRSTVLSVLRLLWSSFPSVLDPQCETDGCPHKS